MKARLKVSLLELTDKHESTYPRRTSLAFSRPCVAGPCQPHPPPRLLPRWEHTRTAGRRSRSGSFGADPGKGR